MNIIVVGCGKIGKNIIMTLKDEGYDIVAIDNDPNVINDLTNSLDIMTLVGNATSPDVLIEANIVSCDLFISTTGFDEINMLTCLLANKLGAKHTIARIRNPEYNDKKRYGLKNSLNISVTINPELVAAEEISNLLKLPIAAKVETFARRAFKMIELKVKNDDEIVNKSLRDIKNNSKYPFLITCVQRNEKVIVPDGNFVIDSGDKICIIGTSENMHGILESLGLVKKEAHKIMILGGGSTSLYLAKALESPKFSVQIIEKNKDRCSILADVLKKAEIVYGDGAKQEVLIEQGLENMDAFVALTGKDEENLLISAFANYKNVPKVITKINRQEWVLMADKFGLDTVITPSKIISNFILRYARGINNVEGRNVETLYKVIDENTEAVEFKVTEDFEKLNVPIYELELKQGINISGILRNREAIIPSGNEVLQVDDRVVIISTNMKLRRLSDILR